MRQRITPPSRARKPACEHTTGTLRRAVSGCSSFRHFLGAVSSLIGGHGMRWACLMRRTTMHRAIHLGPVLALTVFPWFVHAQSETSASPSDIPTREEVVITATRFAQPAQEIPIGVSIITDEQIMRSGVNTLPQLLARQPGITVRDNSGSPDQSVDMRGFGITGDQNTLVMVDGQRLSENELTTARWSTIPLSAIDRIEILRGSGAVLYGANA